MQVPSRGGSPDSAEPAGDWAFWAQMDKRPIAETANPGTFREAEGRSPHENKQTAGGAGSAPREVRLPAGAFRRAAISKECRGMSFHIG